MIKLSRETVIALVLSLFILALIVFSANTTAHFIYAGF
jgi:hypothetical protein